MEVHCKLTALAAFWCTSLVICQLNPGSGDCVLKGISDQEEILLHLLKNSGPSRHLIIVYDPFYEFLGLNMMTHLMEQFSRKYFLRIAVFKHDKRVSNLTKSKFITYLRRQTLRKSATKVLFLTKKWRLLHLLQTVKDHHVYYYKHIFIGSADFDTLATIQAEFVVPKGMTLLMVTRIPTSFHEFAVTMSFNSKNITKIRHLYHWNSAANQCALPDVDHILRRQRRKNLRNDVITVSALDNYPFFSLHQDSRGLFHSVDGVDWHLLKTLAESLHFRFKIVPPDDSQWGSLDDDDETWTGMIGMVYRQEADMALGELPVTEVRASAVEFSRPYFFQPVLLVTRRPKSFPNVFALFLPFTIEVWITFIVIVIVSVPLLWLLRVAYSHGFSSVELRRSPSEGLCSAAWCLTRIILLQGYSRRVHGNGERIFMAAWSMQLVVMTCFYSGLLLSFIVVPSAVHDINTLEDLAEAMEKGDMSMAVNIGTAMSSMLEDSEGGIYRLIWKQISQSNGQKVLVAPTNLEGMQAVRDQGLAYLGSRAGVLVAAAELGKDNFHISPEGFTFESCAIAVTRGWPYMEQLNEKLLQIMEAGLISKWMNDVEEIRHRRRKHRLAIDYQPIRLAHLFGAGLLCFGGFCCACVAFLAELLIQKIRPRRRR